MSAFADTSGLYALMVKSEERHEEVARSFADLLRKRRVLSTTSYVIVETTALLQHRIGLEVVHDFEEQIVPFLAIEWVAQALHRRGVEMLFREDRRQLSLVDCVSLEFMKSSRLRDVLGLDPHFQEAGFRLLPPRK